MGIFYFTKFHYTPDQMYNVLINMPGRLRSKSLTSQILNIFITEVDDLLFLFSHPHAVLRTVGDVESARLMLIRKEKKLKRINKQKIQQALVRLESQKLIQIHKMGNQIFYFLTENGIQEGLKQVIQNKKQKLPNGLQCYVSFDIPEKVSSVRWALRKLLKSADFKMVHLSLWGSKYNVGKEMACFIKSINAEMWVHVFEARSLTQKTKNKN